MQVEAWEEEVMIPSYGVGEPEKNPAFLEKRVYQGSSGEVYPYPIIEKIYDEKREKEWQTVFIENKYIKVMIIPELGGRIQMAYDKIKDRHFAYYNQVIKPALVGLLGPWISGGIEFNWPQHHRPTTFKPTEYEIEESKEGAKTVWCSEVERLFRTKGMVGFTLYPDKAYIELNVKLYNRTDRPQTFLWWANPAVSVNEEWRAVFPPDVNAVFDHGKRDVSEFPIAKGSYYKVDYSEGVDISKYKNLPVPTSYMVAHSDYDFVGGYNNKEDGGILHIADHHISPGKKLWTWGNSDFGKAWERNLTDEDGPYVELMCGVYTDNQPDFSWLTPFEEKSFQQYFLPYRDIKGVKNANKDLLLNLEFEDEHARINIYPTSEQEDLTVILKNSQEVVFNQVISVSPENIYEKTVEIEAGPDPQDYILTIKNKQGEQILSYQPESNQVDEFPEPAETPGEPKEIETNERLYLIGLHLEQYHHATYLPEDYYKEALRRDPADVRCNNAMGMLCFRRGRLQKAESYFRTAIERSTDLNPNPYNGEPYYNLGQVLKYQGKLDQAYGNLYKACWNSEFKAPGHFALAQISCWRDNFQKALQHIDKSLQNNTENHKALHLKIAILRKLEHTEAALSLIKDALKKDRFNFGARFEKILLNNDEQDIDKFIDLIGEARVHNYIEYSLDYAKAGLFQAAEQLLDLYLENAEEDIYPMVYYFKGWYNSQNGEDEAAQQFYSQAKQCSPDYCCPNRLEEMLSLKSALEYQPQDSKALYYLGNYYYGAKQYDIAREYWEESKQIKSDFPTVRRNLSLAYFNKEKEEQKAVQELEAAFELDQTDARVLMELDQLYKRLNYDYEDRLKFLESNLECVLERDDLYLSRVTLYNYLDLPAQALELLQDRKFHPWEGGEGKVKGQYELAHVRLAQKRFSEEQYEKALDHLRETEDYPNNLGEGKLPIEKDNDIYFWKGCVYEQLQEDNKAKEAWQKATEGEFELSRAMYYNDQGADTIFYQGLAHRKLGQEKEAEKYFDSLVDYGKKHINDEVKIDYFAVSLPDLMIWDDDQTKRNRVHCLYLMGLGYLGYKNYHKAEDKFNTVLELNRYHQGALIHNNLISNKNNILKSIVS